MLSLNIGTDKSKRQRFKKYLANQIAVLRSGSAINPMLLYNPTSGVAVSGNDVALDWGDYRFVGGDTLEVNYDLGTKVGGSNTECPVELLVSRMSTLQTPSSPITGDSTTGWYKYVANEQTVVIDKVKVQGDGLTCIVTSNMANQIVQLMAEIDMSALLTIFGTNALMKSAVKSIQVDVFAKGEGSNSGVLTSGVDVKVYGLSWNTYSAVSNTTSSIAKITKIITSSMDFAVQSNNKLNILIASQYASDGTIASKVELDYISVKIVFSRAVDQPVSKALYVPPVWSMIGGFSPQFDSSRSGITNRVFSFYQDVNNRYSFVRTSNIWTFAKLINGVYTEIIATLNNTFSKNQLIRYIVGQSKDGMFMYLLKNNGTVEQVANTNTAQLIGMFPLHFLHQNGSQQGDMWADEFRFLPYYSPANLTEATDILKANAGNKAGIVDKNLFSLTNLTLKHANATVDLNANTLTLNATAGSQYSYIEIPVLPNNRYELAFSKTGVGGYVDYDEKYNNILLKSYYPNLGKNADGTYSMTLTTGNNTNKIRLYISNTVAGLFTWSNISLKLKM